MSEVTVQTYDFGPRFSELVLHELDVLYSRNEVDLAATTAAIPFGSVLMRDSNGKYAPLTEAAASGEGDGATPARLNGEACAVLIGAPDIGADAPVSTTPQKALALTGYCMINASRLVFGENVTLKAAALADLAKRGFVVKEA